MSDIVRFVIDRCGIAMEPSQDDATTAGDHRNETVAFDKFASSLDMLL